MSSSSEDDQEEHKLFTKLPISIVNFFVVDSSVPPTDIMALTETDGMATQDSYRFELAPSVISDHHKIEEMFPGIAKLDSDKYGKKIDAYCGMCYFESVNQNAAVMIFISDSKTAQVRVAYDPGVIDKGKANEIMNGVVSVLKA